jgi:hypothetical protein
MPALRMRIFLDMIYLSFPGANVRRRRLWRSNKRFPSQSNTIVMALTCRRRVEAADADRDQTAGQGRRSSRRYRRSAS